MLSRPRRRFLIALGTLFGPPAPATQTGAIATKGRTFLQLSRYDRMPEKYFKPYFEAIDQHYTPAMLKAPGLLRYQRFRHYDLPERIGIELWESEQAAKAWHDSADAKALWERATSQFRSRLSPEYLQAMHSFAHYHYILEESFKA
jgi:quinol monooxygenase YgiN